VFYAHGEGYKSGSAIKGEDIKFSLPEGPYLAVMFAGVANGTKLLAIGVPTDVLEGENPASYPPDLAGGLNITINTTTIVFTLTALSAGVESGGRNSFHITEPLEFATDVPSGYYTVNSVETPFFKVPALNNAEIQDRDESDHLLFRENTPEAPLVYFVEDEEKYYYVEDDSEFTGDPDSELSPEYIYDLDDESPIKGTLNIGGFGDIPDFHHPGGEEQHRNPALLFDIISGSIKSMGISAYNPVTDSTVYPRDVTGEIFASNAYINKDEDDDEGYGKLVIPFGIKTGVENAVHDNAVGFSMIRFDIQVQAFYGHNSSDEGVDTTGARGSVWHISNGLEPGAFDLGGKSIGQNILLSIGSDPNGQLITTDWGGKK
jgi:hypothetical protein